MTRRRPNLRWHIDTAQHPTSPQVTARFAGVRDYGLGQLVTDPDLEATIVAAMPTLWTHAHELLDQHWTRPIPQDSPTIDLDILIRVVDAAWCAGLSEVGGVQGQWDASGTPKIMLLCAAPDPALLTARFIHEFGHYLDCMHSPSADGFPMSDWLRAETAAEQLVTERLGGSALTHNRTCTPAARQHIHQLLMAEDPDDVAAQDASYDFIHLCGPGRRTRVLEAYALVNEIVRRGHWTFKDLLRVNDGTFRTALLNSQDLWAPSAALEQA